MTTTTRRLAAILAADIAGYSAAMERDEEGTAAAVRALRREVIEPKLSEHQGRLIKTPVCGSRRRHTRGKGLKARVFALVLSITAMLLAYPQTLQAQPTAKPVIAVLISGSAVDVPIYFDAFRQAFAELGYLDGRDYLVDMRAAEGEHARLPALARELLRAKPRLIFASSGPAVLAAREATSEVPIVSPFLGAVASFGFIASQARPGSNVTGIVGSVDAGLIGKQIALARDIKPSATKIGVLRNPSMPRDIAEMQRASVEAAAAILSLDLFVAEAGTGAELPEAFAKFARANVDVVWVSADPLYFTIRHDIAKAAEAAQLPTIFAFREYVEAGGLASYGIDLAANYRRAAAHVDKILRGTRAADLPVEAPTKFELVINLKTARRIGLSLPEMFLVRADQVID